MTQKGYDPFSFGQVKVGSSDAGGRAPTPEDILFDPHPAKPAPGKGVAKGAPTKAQPDKAEKAQPAKTQPTKAQPTKAEPTKAEPAKGAPTKGLPMKSTSAKVARDTSWDPPGGAVADNMSADDFGAEILGEQGSKARPTVAPTPTAAPTLAPAPARTASGIRQVGRAQSPGAGAATPSALTHTLAMAAAKAAGPVAPAPVRPKSVPPSAVPIAAPPRGAIVVVAPLLVFAGGEGLAAWLYFVQHNPVLAGIAAALGLLLAGVARIALRR